MARAPSAAVGTRAPRVNYRGLDLGAGSEGSDWEEEAHGLGLLGGFKGGQEWGASSTDDDEGAEEQEEGSSAGVVDSSEEERGRGGSRRLQSGSQGPAGSGQSRGGDAASKKARIAAAKASAATARACKGKGRVPVWLNQDFGKECYETGSAGVLCCVLDYDDIRRDRRGGVNALAAMAKHVLLRSIP